MERLNVGGREGDGSGIWRLVYRLIFMGGLGVL